MGPYPGYPPSYGNIDSLGDLKRTCLVIDLLSLDKLTNVQLAQISEQLDIMLAKLKLSIITLEKFQIVTPDRFDRLLQTGLRLG